MQGMLLSRNGAGTIKILAPDSSIESGDRLLTRPGTYARLTFTDHTAVTLGPDSELVIVQYSYSDTAHSNSAVFDFVQGRVGNRRRPPGRTQRRPLRPRIRRSERSPFSQATFIAGFTAPPRTARLHFLRVPQPDRETPMDVLHFENVVYHPPNGQPPPRLLLAQNTATPDATTGLNPGLYVQVLDGTINVTNGGGTQNFTAGQFGFTPGFQQPPVILPSNPGMQFTPPPSFSSTTGASNGSSEPSRAMWTARFASG